MAARVETRGRRPKILEPPKEPARSRTHWDHVLEEMVWLAKDFESERKWKLAHAKRVALRVSKSGLDQASRGEKRLKEEEQRTRRLASNISKDVRKFWMKIEKLVLYKHQLETEERKKRALDKQLDFLLGQTERYSTMLAENLVDLPSSHERKSQLLLQSSPIKPGIEVSDHQYKHDRLSSKDPSGPSGSPSQIHISDEEAHSKILDRGSHLDNEESEDEFSLGGADDMEDDEATLEADEALITEDERREELAALKNESDLPIEELLKRYRHNNGSKSGENDSECNSEANGQDFEENVAVSEEEKSEHMNFGVESIEADTNRDTDFKRTATSDSQVTKLDTYDEQHENEGLGNGVMFGKQNVDFIDAVGNESRTISDHSIDVVEEKDGNHFVSLLVDLTEASNIHSVSGDGNRLSTTFVHDTDGGKKGDPLDKAELNDGILSCEQRRAGEETATSSDSGNETDDGEYTNAALTGEEEDDEVTLLEEEELARAEGNDTTEEVEFLKAESELPIEELLARYKQIKCLDEENADEPEDTDGTSEAGKNISSAIPDEKLEDDAQRMGTNLDYDGSITEEKDSDAVLKAKISPPETNELQKTTEEEKTSEVRIADAAAAARLAQPTGNTFSTTKVRTKLPFLLKHSLREYQHIGLDWLVTMYEKRLNGILADEMGLGKTIMTIALLAHLACEKGIWGPHLIVVPTSVMLNWETEFMKWCPAFKVLTYFGSAKERKIKRQGWAKPNSFHVCITTYRLVIQDAKAFKRKKWKYLILDEAHLIKNWKSQRWQTLLNFNSKRRILLTGTPLQNDLMELWSLMHFLMPHLFQSQQEFKDWFCNPISGMVERQEQVNKEVVDRLHNVLRPFILRRLKQDVEKQLPKKYEHVICCKLSKRQRNLYEDFIANSETQATLASGNFLGLINVLMQLRKVCNHPDLFEGRPIVSSFDMLGLEQQVCSDICSIFKGVTYSAIDLVGMNLVFSQLEFMMNSWEYDHVSKIATPSSLIQEIGNLRDEELAHTGHRQQPKHRRNIFEEIQHALHEERLKQARGRAAAIAWLNTLRCKRKPVYGMDLKRILTIEHPVFDLHKKRNNPSWYLESSSRLADLVLLPSQRCQKLLDLIESFVFAIPAARAPPPIFWCSKSGSSVLSRPTLEDNTVKEFSVLLEPLRPVIVRRQLFFPDRRLIQFDCGKLQELAILLRRLRSEGHRALIFTQMTRMLDVLEAFINLYGYTYVRLDGSTQPEERQILMQRFNTNPKIFLFILSTRSGGVGINLVGADTVIFYDSDWNPAMDQQAQDRCHRIGQTREVHIYRLVSERTIEENIIKKANQKRALDDLVIQSGSYNTEFFKKLDPMELFSGLQGVKADKETINGSDLVNHETQHQLSNADVEAALKNAEDEADYMALKKVELEDAADDQEFTEEVVGRLLEDDEYANDMEEARADVKKAQDEPEHSDLKNIQATHVTEIEHTNSINTALVPAVDSEVDVIPDVQQMAVAAAAAGHASTSLEDHLMPVERYAMRFLDLWDPIIDKAAIESQVRFEEEEWELDRLEKLKEELEAEIDEDNEPLLYESWDTEFANETYRQQVEVLAQQQLLQDQLEWDSEKEAGLDADGFEAKKSLKLKKKLKKTKFKSLKKRNLDSRKADNGEGLANNKLSFEYENSSDSDELPAGTFSKQKRKALRLFEDEILQKRHSKKLKRQHANLDLSLDRNKQLDQFMDVDVDSDDLEAALNEFASPGSKGNGKILITGIPSKKVSIIKLDKKKKKGTRKSRDHLPCPGPWSTSEDAILCAMVYEYGINWELASDTLYGITSGGFYRGRYRHPVHCRERFGELFLSHISSTATDPNSEKTNSSAKTLLKVTEEHVRKLLDVVQELPDTDWLLQRHFAAVLSAVFRFRNAFDHTRTRNAFPSNSLSVYSGGLSVPVLSHPFQPPNSLSVYSGGLSAPVLSHPFQPPNSLSVYSGGLSAPVLSHPFHTLNVDQGIINVDNANRNFELVAAALAESSKEMADKPCGAASISDQGTFGQKVTREEERATVPVEQLILSLEFPQIPGELDEPPYPKYTTIIVHGADIHPAPPDTSSNFVREPVCSLTGTCMRSVCETVLEGERAAFLSSGTMDISGTKPQGLGKHQPATDLTLPPKPKQPRLLDLNEGLLETDVGMQDLTGPDGNVEGTETTMPVDSSCLNSDLRAHLASISENLVSINLNESDEDIFRLGNIFEASFEQLYDTEIISHQYEPDFTANCCDLGNLSGSAFDALFV